MTVHVLIGILLGHLLGDYVFQNNWMAFKKSQSTFRCLVHCAVYTLCVAALTSWQPLWVLLVFLSHFPIDRWSLADAWGRLIGGRNLTRFIQDGWEGVPPQSQLVSTEMSFHTLRGAFTALVYVVIDNTFHLVLMIGGWYLLNRWVHF